MKYVVLPVLLLAALLPVSSCRGPRETRSVHLPLAVGNRWLYDVVMDSVPGIAVIEVVSGDNGVFGVSLSSDTSRFQIPAGPLRIRCRDSVLWLEYAANREPMWLTVLSDDPADSGTQTMLTFREIGGSKFLSRPVGTIVVGGDTFRDCLRLSCTHVGESFFFFGGGDDSTLVSEDYAPGVGLVRLRWERHWRSWMWFPASFSDSGTWVDRWELRDRQVSE